MYFCYILFSPSLNKYYSGSTSNTVQGRLNKHIEKYYGNNKFTASRDDWTIFLEIPCSTFKQAKAIEKHIKGMKSRKYIENLKKYPEMVVKLLDRFKN